MNINIYRVPSWARTELNIKVTTVYKVNLISALMRLTYKLGSRVVNQLKSTEQGNERSCYSRSPSTILTLQTIL